MKMKIKPLGFRVLVKQKQVEEVTEGGIVLPDTTVNLEQKAATRATVLAIGPSAWKEQMPDGRWLTDHDNRCEVGDEVLIRKYSGFNVEADPLSDMLVNDVDIIGKVENE
jgi:chaperonin GroES